MTTALTSFAFAFEESSSCRQSNGFRATRLVRSPLFPLLRVFVTLASALASARSALFEVHLSPRILVSTDPHSSSANFIDLTNDDDDDDDNNVVDATSSIPLSRRRAHPRIQTSVQLHHPAASQRQPQAATSNQFASTGDYEARPRVFKSRTSIEEIGPGGTRSRDNSADGPSPRSPGPILGNFLTSRPAQKRTADEAFASDRRRAQTGYLPNGVLPATGLLDGLQNRDSNGMLSSSTVFATKNHLTNSQVVTNEARIPAPVIDLNRHSYHGDVAISLSPPTSRTRYAGSGVTYPAEASSRLQPPQLARLTPVRKTRETHGRTDFQELMALAGSLPESPTFDPEDDASHHNGVWQAKRLSAIGVEQAVNDQHLPGQHVPGQLTTTISSSPSTATSSRSSLASSPVVLRGMNSPQSPTLSLGTSSRIVPISPVNYAAPAGIPGNVRHAPSTGPISEFTTTLYHVSQNITGAEAHRFDSSIMPSRMGQAFTEAEQIMVAYLKDVGTLTWDQIDHKMGRTHNSCATKYYRRPHGLHVPAVRMRWNYSMRVAALKAILTTYDPPIEDAVNLLSQHLSTDMLPKSCLPAFEQFKARVQESHLVSNNFPPAPVPPAFSRSSTLPTLFHVSKQTEQHMEGRLRPAARTREGHLSVSRFFETESEDSVTSPTLSNISGADSMAHIDRPKAYPEGSFVRMKKPYLSFVQRRMLNLRQVRGLNALAWDHTPLHVDFDQDELKSLLSRICVRLRLSRFSQQQDTAHHRIRTIMQDMTKIRIRDIASYIKKSDSLPNRSRASIEAFLFDAASDPSTYPAISLRIRARQEPPALPIRRQLLQRELGKSSPHRQLQDTLYGSLHTSLTFTGASGDVGTVAWSPDGSYFAAGAACLVDENSMQYNRSNNLLFGDVRRKTLIELPHHSRARRRTVAGANSTHSMHASQDPRLFETVAMVDFAPDGSFMYSAGYDHHLRAYKLLTEQSMSETYQQPSDLNRAQSPESSTDSSRGSKLRARKPCRLHWQSDHGVKLDLLTVSRNTG
jgi:WD40 repeat protein